MDMQIPETEFTRAGDVRIAYQLFGDGPISMISSGGPAGHVELYWEEPLVRRWYERLAQFGRVALFDRRGTGASDPGHGPPTDERYVEDILAVMDACGFERAALSSGSDAGRTAAAFAAHHPERVSALVLVGVAPHGATVLNPELREQLEDTIENAWGKGRLVDLYAPSMAGDERFRRWAARLERNAVSPQGAREIIALSAAADIRPLLPRIQAPTLMIHRREDTVVPIELARQMAQAIPDCRFVEVEGRDNMAWVGDQDAVLDAMEEFLTGQPARRPRERALASILFTDIVGSTEQAARRGARDWRDLLAEHDRVVRAEIEREGGRVVKNVGDGVLATFDSAAGAVLAAQAAMDVVARLDLRLRAGVHTGEVELLPEDVGGLAVHIAARIVDLARPGAVLVSATVRDILVGSDLTFSEQGTHDLRGVPGRWTLHALDGAPG